MISMETFASQTAEQNPKVLCEILTGQNQYQLEV